MGAGCSTKPISLWHILVTKLNLLSGRKHKLSPITTRQFGVKTSVEHGLVGATMATETANMDGRLTISRPFPKAVQITFPTSVHFSGKTMLPGKMTVCVAKSLPKGTRT